MPRVKPLTKDQAKRQAYERRSIALAKGLGAFKTYEGLTNEQLAGALKVSKNTVPKLLGGKDVALPLSTLWTALDLAGMEIRQKPVNLDA